MLFNGIIGLSGEKYTIMKSLLQFGFSLLLFGAAIWLTIKQRNDNQKP